MLCDIFGQFIILTTNEEIIAAVIMGLSDKCNRNGVLDMVLDLDDSELYPESTEAEKGKCSDRTIVGLDLIVNTLETKYGISEEEKLFKYYEDFENLKRDNIMSMNEYIINFEAAYRKLKNTKIILNDIVLSYRLLKGAQLGKDEKLARTSVATMTFENMKKTLLKMSDGVVCVSDRKNVVPKCKLQIKEEPHEVLYQNYYDEEEDNGYYNFDQKWNQEYDSDDNNPEKSDNENNFIEDRAVTVDPFLLDILIDQI